MIDIKKNVLRINKIYKIVYRINCKFFNAVICLISVNPDES